MTYKPIIVLAWFESCCIPACEFEYVFSPPRKWRFDLAWPDYRLAVEVQGGIWQQGRHNRGAALLREWTKLNTAACLGWRILYCQPADLCTLIFAQNIIYALKAGHRFERPPQ